MGGYERNCAVYRVRVPDGGGNARPGCARLATGASLGRHLPAARVVAAVRVQDSPGPFATVAGRSASVCGCWRTRRNGLLFRLAGRTGNWPRWPDRPPRAGFLATERARPPGFRRSLTGARRGALNAAQKDIETFPASSDDAEKRKRARWKDNLTVLRTFAKAYEALSRSSPVAAEELGGAGRLSRRCP